ncbi:hypothetical protein A2926_01960 [Candidatus Giovannonibacteria bacterium RIFCSPLOWO2_01_FULL_44_40]|uniref:Glycosyltransferase RgtA/B/C/D-like domain-containing protein n=1 Tax=Candidatus Giovannonibacteria bacterium RIFCSPHIGHO2_01_FULL_45_23 TaxID=1798325 RepID=A0A1F5VGA2_9BACT|nr:MAG: hypothetical protein A2834_03330 [Candidatus Giovannonibacteria bacterium RIFCSPHIGHO2_01_FULL_45_23]OGF76921.1 MAG: hypothetical protein A3C77_04820 [Candidatus Giovannonibacteria bacterium RIFCSPHIGHO2_02_FULL_45_13]OGF80292.1 MAG: hypothetical protein A2926_01960 [Candidatus Giovannonibacteria bacterium RIFCSPLOWO2_01_FULL_44_40]
MTKRFFKEHYLIAVSGLLLTLLIEAPLLAFPFVSKNYQDINIPHFGTDSHFYLSRAQEALERNNLGNAFLREGKDNQDAYFVYNERALALLPRVFGLADAVSAPTFYAIYNFAGVFALILLIYFFTLQLAPGKLLAAVAAIFVVGGYHIAYKDFFYMDFNLYGRPIFPYLSSLALFLYLFFLVKSVNTDRVAYKISAGVLFGALFYVIFYGWTFVLALNGALFLFYLFKKDFARLKMIAQISAIGVSLGLYNFVKMLRFAASDIGSQSSYFNWAYHTHKPIFSKVTAAALALFLFFYYKKKRDPNLILILGLISAFWIVLNQQIITGRVEQPAHYHWWFIVPLAIISALYMLWVLLEKYEWRRFLFGFILFAVFAHSALGQYRSFWTTLPGKEYEQLYRPIIAELQKDPNSGVILAADDYLAYLFTIYTRHDLFWHTGATATVMPMSRFYDTLYVYAYLSKNPLADPSYKQIYQHIKGFESGLDYYDYISKATGVAEIIKPQIDANNLLKKYGVNYIVWDKNRNPEWDLSFIKNLRPVTSYNNIYLFQIMY